MIKKIIVVLESILLVMSLSVNTAGVMTYADDEEIITNPEGQTGEEITDSDGETGEEITNPEDESEEEIITSIADYEYYESGIESFTIPDTVTKVGVYAFASNEALNDISLGNIPYISSGMFYNCTALEEIIIPDSVTQIKNHAFNGCVSLKSIEIPESVSKVGNYAFLDCKSLEKVSIKGSIDKISAGMFEGCELLSDFTVSEGPTEIGASAFKNCQSLYNLVIPEGVEKIGDEAYDGCCKLLNVKIPDSVTYISDSAFSNCQNKLNIVGTIDSYAHEYANSHGINFTEIEVVEPEVSEKLDLTKADVSIDETEFLYDGKAHRPLITVMYEDKLLVEGVDYSLVYSAVKLPGTHKAVINGMGEYQGKKTKKYDIVLTPPKSFKCVNVKKKRLRINAKKKYSKGKITGYQIAYKLNTKKKFTTKRIKDSGSIKYYLEGLKKNKKYDVKIRCYVKYGKKKYYSEWSVLRTRKVRK